MLKPSYAELMEVLNKDIEDNSEITSRYTIVIAASKRARQIIDGDEPMVEDKKGKPLSTAVEEIYESKIKVVPEGQGTILNTQSSFEDDYFTKDEGFSKDEKNDIEIIESEDDYYDDEEPNDYDDEESEKSDDYYDDEESEKSDDYYIKTKLNS